MSRTPFVVANWKMNGNTQANLAWIESAKPQLHAGHYRCDIAVCAPALYLTQLVDGFKNTAVMVGAQNCASYEEGAYTGEISAAMLADVDCDLVILGHSERRTLFGDTDELVAENQHVCLSQFQTVINLIGGITIVQRHRQSARL